MLTRVGSLAAEGCGGGGLICAEPPASGLGASGGIRSNLTSPGLVSRDLEVAASGVSHETSDVNDIRSPVPNVAAPSFVQKHWRRLKEAPRPPTRNEDAHGAYLHGGRGSRTKKSNRVEDARTHGFRSPRAIVRPSPGADRTTAPNLDFPVKGVR